MYPEQVTVSQNPITITCIINYNERNVIQTKFIKSNDIISVSVSNNKASIQQHSKKTLQKIESKLNNICKEQDDSMPIYQCISYLNDTLKHDSEIFGIRSKNEDKYNQNKKKIKVDNNNEEKKDDDI